MDYDNSRFWWEKWDPRKIFRRMFNRFEASFPDLTLKWKERTRSMNSPSLCGEGVGACCAMAGATTLSIKPSTRINPKGNLAISSSKFRTNTLRKSTIRTDRLPLDWRFPLSFASPLSACERAEKREKLRWFWRTRRERERERIQWFFFFFPSLIFLLFFFSFVKQQLLLRVLIWRGGAVCEETIYKEKLGQRCPLWPEYLTELGVLNLN